MSIRKFYNKFIIINIVIKLNRTPFCIADEDGCSEIL